MTTTKRDVDDMVRMATARAERLGSLLERVVRTGEPFRPDEAWFERLEKRTAELEKDGLRGDHRAQAAVLLSVLVLSLQRECMDWVCWQIVARTGADTWPEERKRQFIACCVLPSDKPLSELSRRLKAFNPVETGRRDFNLWLARQDSMLLEAGFLHADVRKLREVVGMDETVKDSASRRGISLKERTKRARRPILMDQILPRSDRAKRETIFFMLKAGRGKSGPRGVQELARLVRELASR